MTSEEKKQLKELEKALGISFKKLAFLKKAITHKSYTNELKLPPSEHNERIEFLGDAVLELCISHLLIDEFEDAPEGELSKIRASVVNEAQLAAIAEGMNLGNYLYLGKGEDLTGGRKKPSLLSDAYEAVLGAVYLDQGFKKAFALVQKHFMELILQAGREGFSKDYKTRLQEEVQGRFKVVPRYQLISATGPDHNKTFEIHLFIRNDMYGVGLGNSKKSAEQEAAKQALEKLDKEKV